jgi:hypothetical protein
LAKRFETMAARREMGHFFIWIRRNPLKSPESLTGLTGAAPEPGTWAMMGLGFAGLDLVAYRRRLKAPSRSADLKPKSEQDRGRPFAAAAEANALVTFK